MKYTISSVLKKFKFLESLLSQPLRPLSPQKRVTFEIKTTPVDLAPINDGVCRYTSAGSIHDGTAVSHFAGSSDTEANNPAEFSSDSPIAGKTVNPGFFYAVLDLQEYYNYRHLTLFINSQDADKLLPKELE